jgi:hypothetical protein
MRSPAKGVNVIEIDDYESINIKEVLERGIHRRRPASGNGEELRDVAIWLLVLSLAKKSRTGIVFISGDKTFLNEQELNLHPSLSADIASCGSKISFYKGLREFIIANALNQEPVDSRAFRSLIPIERIEELARRRMKAISTSVGDILTVDFRELEPETAIKYKVGENTYYIEARLGGVARVCAQEQFTNPISANFWLTTPTIDPSPVGFGQNQGMITVRDMSLEPGQFSSYTPIGLDQPNTVKLNALIPPKPRNYLCSFKLGVSSRMVGGVAKSIELDSFQFKSFLPDEK